MFYSVRIFIEKIREVFAGMDLTVDLSANNEEKDERKSYQKKKDEELDRLWTKSDSTYEEQIKLMESYARLIKTGRYFKRYEEMIGKVLKI